MLLDISPTRPFGSWTGDTCASHKFRYRKRIYFSARQNSTFIAAEAPEYKDVGDLEYEANLKVWPWLISADPITLEAVSDASTIIVRLAHTNRKPPPCFYSAKNPWHDLPGDTMLEGINFGAVSGFLLSRRAAAIARFWPASQYHLSNRYSSSCSISMGSLKDNFGDRSRGTRLSGIDLHDFE